MRQRGLRIVTRGAGELSNRKLALPPLPVIDATLQRRIVPIPEEIPSTADRGREDEHRDERKQPGTPGRRRRHRFRSGKGRCPQPLRRHGLTGSAGRRRLRRRRHQSRLELEKTLTRRVDVVVRRMIRRVLGALPRGLKFRQCVGLIEGDQLPLARLANQLLTAQWRSAEERAERGLHARPCLDEVGRQLFRVARTIESGDRRTRGIQRAEGVSVHDP